MGMVDLPPGATLKRTNDVMLKAENAIKNIPGVENVIAISGFSFTSGAGENVGCIIVTLDDWAKRQTPETQIGAIQQKVQKAVGAIPEARIVFFLPPPRRLAACASGTVRPPCRTSPASPFTEKSRTVSPWRSC